MKLVVRITVEGKSKHLKPEFVLRETLGGFEFGWCFNGKRLEKVESRIPDRDKAVYKAVRYLESLGPVLSPVQKELLYKTI